MLTAPVRSTKTIRPTTPSHRLQDMRQTVVGVFSQQDSMEATLRRLEMRGFRAECIGATVNSPNDAPEAPRAPGAWRKIILVAEDGPGEQIPCLGLKQQVPLRGRGSENHVRAVAVAHRLHVERLEFADQCLAVSERTEPSPKVGAFSPLDPGGRHCFASFEASIRIAHGGPLREHCDVDGQLVESRVCDRATCGHAVWEDKVEGVARAHVVDEAVVAGRRM